MVISYDFLSRVARKENKEAQHPRADSKCRGSSATASSLSPSLWKEAAKIRKGGTNDGRTFKQLAMRPFAAEKWSPLGRISMTVLQ